ncbi:MAG: hypothetical protein OQK77_02385 [Psychromonas sp.]|nr:hypothetical protein [Psychromonas sp.]
MSKLWITERTYNFWGSLIRIAYWLGAIFLSTLYLQHYSQQAWFKIGLMLISSLFVVGFIALARLLDHLFKTTKT